MVKPERVCMSVPWVQRGGGGGKMGEKAKCHAKRNAKVSNEGGKRDGKR